MRAQIAGYDDFGARPIDHERLVEQLDGDRGVGDLADQRHRVPVAGQDLPIGRFECAVAWPWQGHDKVLCIDTHDMLLSR